MAITVNTNLSAINIQNNLNDATDAMSKSMLRMSTGFRINSASDDAAGLAVSTSFETTLSSSKVASKNVQIGSNLLTTTEGTLGVIKSNLQRIRDLAEQSANGTYSADDRAAMKAEAQQRALEIDRLANSTSFNGIKLLDGTQSSGIAIQVGTGSSADDSLTISSDVFAKATVSAIQLTPAGGTSIDSAFESAASSKAFLANCTTALTNITNRQTKIGAFQNRLSAAGKNLTVQQTNLTAANSTIKDADVAEESANYVKNQILQSASASLLAAANQAPSIALKLING
ncbi:MAG TPA: flagellin [Candidatus Gastranaerophilaceae bacterium]|nr:flagellin [Candidatus Gastranaerophilaceae bacterium]